MCGFRKPECPPPLFVWSSSPLYNTLGTNRCGSFLDPRPRGRRPGSRSTSSQTTRRATFTPPPSGCSSCRRRRPRRRTARPPARGWTPGCWQAPRCVCGHFVCVRVFVCVCKKEREGCHKIGLLPCALIKVMIGTGIGDLLTYSLVTYT